MSIICVDGPQVFATDTGDSFHLFLVVGVFVFQLKAPTEKPAELKTMPLYLIALLNWYNSTQKQQPIIVMQVLFLMW